MKTNIKILASLLLPALVGISAVAAASSDPIGQNFCQDSIAAMRIVGFLLMAVKILAPLGIIVMGSFDFYSAVTEGNPKEIKKCGTILGKRVLIGLIIFLLPTAINMLINSFGSPGDYQVCANCVMSLQC